MAHNNTIEAYIAEQTAFSTLMERTNYISFLGGSAIKSIHDGSEDGSVHLQQLRLHEGVFKEVLEDGNSDDAQIEAAVREFDLLFSGLHKVRAIAPATADDWRMVDDLLKGFAGRTHTGSPRASAYHYSWGNDDRTKTYTGHPSELAIIESFDSSLRHVSDTVHFLLPSRIALQERSADASVERLMEQALESMTSAAQVIKAANRGGIDIAFVSYNLFPLFKAVEVSGKHFEGPNPSHTEFAVLDALILGNLLKSQEDSPTIRNLEYRLSDAPHFVRNLLFSDAITTDTLTGLAKVAGNSTIQDLSRLIAKQSLHFKGPHKRMADASLKVRGKVLSSEDPDLLSELIERTKDASRE